jgi:hypothetical protein
MKKVFICSALRGDVAENIKKAKEYCLWAMLNYGVLPIAPHIYFTQFLNDNKSAERELGIDAGIVLLKTCSELWYFGDRVTRGMVKEINVAKSLGIKVKYIDRKELNMNNEWRKVHENSL